MSVDPARIGAIVAEVLDRIERDPADPSAARPLRFVSPATTARSRTLR